MLLSKKYLGDQLGYIKEKQLLFYYYSVQLFFFFSLCVGFCALKALRFSQYAPQITKSHLFKGNWYFLLRLFWSSGIWDSQVSCWSQGWELNEILTVMHVGGSLCKHICASLFSCTLLLVCKYTGTLDLLGSTSQADNVGCGGIFVCFSMMLFCSLCVSGRHLETCNTQGL